MRALVCIEDDLDHFEILGLQSDANECSDRSGGREHWREVEYLNVVVEKVGPSRALVLGHREIFFGISE